MSKTIPKGTIFELGSGDKKYKAILPDGKTVSFGHRNYEHYKDTVPKSMGGGKWSSKNHNDAKRRASYRARASEQKCKNGKRCIDIKYSPAWFSYYFLW